MYESPRAICAYALRPEHWRECYIYLPEKYMKSIVEIMRESGMPLSENDSAMCRWPIIEASRRIALLALYRRGEIREMPGRPCRLASLLL